MATVKLYLTNDTATYTPATVRGTWDAAGATFATKGLRLTKIGGAATAAGTETSSANPYGVRLFRAVSEPLGAAYSFTASDSINVIWGAVSAQSYRTKLYAYVTQGDSDNLRGALVDNAQGTSAWPTTAAGVSDTFTCGSVSALAGDRIVLVLGFNDISGTSTSNTGTINYGNTGATDLTAASTNVTTEPGNVTITTGTGLTFANTISVNDSVTVTDLGDIGARIYANFIAGTGASLAVTGVGFQPDIVIAKKVSGSPNNNDVVVKTSDLAANTAVILRADSGFGTDLITSFDADGFTFGTSTYINSSAGTLIGYIAIKKSKFDDGITTFSYTGDATDGKVITLPNGITWTPEGAWIKGNQALTGAWRHTSATDTFQFWGGTPRTDLITGLGAGTVTVNNGSANSANEVNAAVLNCGVAFDTFTEFGGQIKVGTYSGSGTAQNIDVGFKPDFVMLQSPTVSSPPYFKFPGMSPGWSTYTDGDTMGVHASYGSNYNRYIREVISSPVQGFSIGTDDAVNKSGQTYCYIAIKASNTPSNNPFAVYQNDYVKAVDNRLNQLEDTVTVTDVSGGTGGSGETYQAVGQKFLGISGPLNSAQVKIWKWGTPTDNVSLVLADSSYSTLATSDAVGCGSFNAGDWVTFTFASPYTMVGGTEYNIYVQRSGARDTSNKPAPYSTTTDTAMGGSSVFIKRDNNTWSSVTGQDLTFLLNIGGNITITFPVGDCNVNVNDTVSVTENVTPFIPFYNVSTFDQVVVVASGIQQTLSGSLTAIAGGTGTSGQTNQAASQKFVAMGTTISDVSVQITKVVSPTDDVVVRLVSSLGGAALGTAQVNYTNIVDGEFTKFAFSSPVTVTNGNTYYIEIDRSGARDTTNRYSVGSTSGNPYPYGGLAVRGNNTWGSESATVDTAFIITFADTTKLEENSFISVSDAITVSEAVVVEIVSLVSVNDAVTVTESAALTLVHLISVNDAVAITEAVTLEENSYISVSDTVTANESVAFTFVSTISVFDTATITESVVLQEVSSIDVNDAVAVTEGVAILPISLISVNDAVAVAESVALTLISDISVNDAITVVDAVVKYDDTVYITEFVNVAIRHDCIVSDAITVSENISFDASGGDRIVAVNDTVTVAEFIQLEVNSFVSKSETITVTDVPSFQITSFISQSDLIRVTESFGDAVSFNGTATDFITSSVAFPSTAFTFEFWYNPTAWELNDRVIDWQDSGPTDGVTFVQQNPTDTLAMAIRDTTTQTANLAFGALTPGKWYHLVGTFDSSGAGTAKVYKDGAFVTQDTAVTITSPAAALTFAKRAGGTNNFSGAIDEFRLYNRALSPTEVTDHYNGIYADESGLQVWYNFSGTGATDLSGNGNNGSVTGTTKIESSIKSSGRVSIVNDISVSDTVSVSDIPTVDQLSLSQNVNRVLVTDGFNEYVEVPDHDDFSVPTTGEISISFWMRPDVLNNAITTASGVEGDYVNFLGKSVFGSPNQCEWEFRMYNLDGGNRPNRVSFYVFNSDGGLGVGSYFEGGIGGTPNMVAGEWVHVVGKIDSTYTYMYRNGVLKDSDDYTASITPANTTAPLRFGTVDGDSAADPGYWRGGLDDIRIYNRALTDAEVSQIYAEGRTGSTVDNGLVHRWVFDEANGTTANDSVGTSHGTFNGGGTLGALYGVVVNDAVTVSESVQHSITSFVNVSDTVTISEFIRHEITSFVNISDTVTVSEAITISPVSFVSVFDSITVAESIATAQVFGASVFDTVTIAENIDRTGQLIISVSDLVTVSENIQFLIVSFINVNDTITVEESASALRFDTGLPLPIGEDIVVSENVAFELNSIISVSDLITVSETVGLSPVSFVSVSDAVTVTELVQLLNIYNVSVNDAITVAEFIDPENAYGISVFDLITLAESVSREVVSRIDISDTITVSENLTILHILPIVVFDTVTVTESVLMQFIIPISVSDGITVYDKIEDIRVMINWNGRTPIEHMNYANRNPISAPGWNADRATPGNIWTDDSRPIK